jgi:transcriptional regulator with XRE-family HTH domain
MLNKFSEELKEARVKSELTLQQIAARTRIDLKFLENIEHGNFFFLPELYIKAFLREYSRLVGLDEQITLNKFEAAKLNKVYDELGNAQEEIKKVKQEKEEPKQKLQPQPEAAAPVPVFEAYDPSSQQPQPSPGFTKRKKMIIVISAAILAIIIIIYFAFIKGSSEIIVSEKSYGEIQKENERGIIQETPGSVSKDSVYTTGTDSLSLTLTATDSSWIKILTDNKKTEEFILFPNSHKELKALKDFKLIIGNSAAVHFKLNNKYLDFSGKKHEVRFVDIDLNGLKYMSSVPNF